MLESLNMDSDDGRTSELPEKHTDQPHSDTEVSGDHDSDKTAGKTYPPGRKTARFNIPDNAVINSGSNNNSSNLTEDACLEVTLGVPDDSVAVHGVKTAGGDDVEGTHSQISLLAQGIEKTSTKIVGSSVVRNASSKFKRLATVTKRSTADRFARSKSAATYARKGLKFISKTDGNAGWTAMENKFDKLTAKTNGLLPRSLFGECIGMNKDSNDFAVELFDALTRRRNISGGAINKEQLKEFWDEMADQGFDSRLQTFFDMVDRDADGRITEAEVREIIKLSASANKLSNIQKQADEYAKLIMEELDTDKLGYVMIETLEMVLLKTLPQAARGEGQNLSKVLGQQLQSTQDTNSLRRRYQNCKYLLQDNCKRAWVLALWIAVMAGLFTWKYLQYKNKEDVYEVMGHCVCMAKGAAETLKLNMALILLPVCRNTITWLRNKTKLGKAIPFDDNLNFHFVVATGIGLGVGIHGIYHLACDFPRLLHASEEKYKPMEKYFGEQPSSYWWFVKGWEGLTGIIMVVLMAIAFTLASPWLRRNKRKLPKLVKKLTGFNAFWYSHHLFVIVYACLIIHGIKLYLTKGWYKKTTWMYIAVPVILYGTERLIRAFRSSIEPVKILDVAFYPGGVTALHMSKPENFRYKSGQYMFVNCAAVSPFEWHPFSITSSPGDDYLSVHIRVLGDWTGQIRNVFSKVCQPPPDGKKGLVRDDGLQGPNPNYPRVLIDGPYGAPAQDYKQYEVVLLVGLGIGATPMISIVKDIVNNMKANEEEKNALENGLLTSPLPITNSPSPIISKSKRKSGLFSTVNDEFKTTRAYFYWVTREQGSFDWFKGVMNEVAELDDKGVIEMHNYCTSVHEEGDPRSVFITMLQSINHAKNGVDVVAGTRVKSHFAKPNWQNVYQSIADNHKDSRVGVFYCGAPIASIELKKLASEFSHATSTKFDFHKENF